MRSPVHPHSTGVEEDQEFKVPSTSGGTTLAPEIVVQRSSGSTPGLSKSSTSEIRSSVSERKRSTHRPRYVQTSRLAVIGDALRKRKFSERASYLISRARRKSTTIVYNAKWKIYSSWCGTRQVDPLSPSMRRLADFLIYLFDERKLAISTIKGYRSMISQTLAFRGLRSIGTDPFLSELVRASELERPVTRSLTPKWDLFRVLMSLTKAPYDPLSQTTLQAVTWKTVFSSYFRFC